MKRVVFKKGILAFMLLLALGASAGCGEKEQNREKAAAVSKEDVKKETKEAYNATKAYTREQMQAFREKAEATVDEYKEKIDQLQAKAEQLEGDAKANAERQLTLLRQKRNDMAEKMKELGSSSEDAWEEIKSGFEAAKEDLSNAYQEALAEFDKSREKGTP